MTLPALLPPGPLPAADVAFYVVFSVFVVAFVVLSVITLRWAVQRDRVGREQWARRQAREGRAPGAPPPSTNGRQPPDRSGRRPKAPG